MNLGGPAFGCSEHLTPASNLSGLGCSREKVGTILAFLGVAFRFLTLAGQADAQTLGGIYEVPPIFCSPALAAVSPRALVASVDEDYRPCGPKAVHSLTRRSQQVARLRCGYATATCASLWARRAKGMCSLTIFVNRN